MKPFLALLLAALLLKGSLRRHPKLTGRPPGHAHDGQRRPGRRFGPFAQALARPEVSL